jgi:hypothetical protein
MIGLALSTYAALGRRPAHGPKSSRARRRLANASPLIHTSDAVPGSRPASRSTTSALTRSAPCPSAVVSVTP